jgi:hypothetical protein
VQGGAGAGGTPGAQGPQGFQGAAGGTGGSLTVHDTRDVTTTPQTIDRSVVFDFKSNASNGLNDGGTYFGLMTFRQYGSGSDWTGGRSHQLGFTDNDNLWHRSGTNTTWGTWYKIYHQNNDGSGSGLDADLLDGKNSLEYLHFRGAITGDAGCDAQTGIGLFQVSMTGYSDLLVQLGGVGGSTPSIQLRANYNDSFWIRASRDSETQWDSVGSRSNLIWHSNNDGSGSGLDADTLDSYHAAAFALLTGATFSGQVNIGTSTKLAFGSQTRQMIDLWASSYGIGVQDSTIYFRSGSRFSWHRGGSHSNAENNAGVGGVSAMTLDVSSNLIVTGDITAYSDARRKDNILEIHNAIDRVKKIRGITYTRNDQEDKITRHAGVIAQEVLKVLPEVVHYDEESDTYSVAYGNMVGLLIEAIKEQQTQIEYLKETLEALK